MMDTTTFSSNLDLLEQLKDQNNSQIWKGFFYRYQPVVIGFGRRMGLSDSDAQDVAQDVLMSFVKAFREGQYNPAKGRLRTWLMAIASNRIREQFRRSGRHKPQEGREAFGEEVESIPDPNTMTRFWDGEWQRAVLKACIEEVRSQTTPRNMAVFSLIVQDQCSPADVAEKLDMSIEAVYRTKNRVLARMRDVRERLEKEW